MLLWCVYTVTWLFGNKNRLPLEINIAPFINVLSHSSVFMDNCWFYKSSQYGRLN